MGAWNRSKEVLYVDWCCYVFAICVIIYLFVRHMLLVSGRLEPDQIRCGDCTKAVFSSILHPSDIPRMATKQSSTDHMEVHLKVASNGTFVCLLFYLLYCISDMPFYMSHAMLDMLPFSYCQYAIAVSGLLYQCAKASLYTVFVARLHIGFEGSASAYSKKVILTLYAVVAVVFVVVGGLTMAFARAKRIEGSDGETTHYCENRVPVFGYMPGLLFDLLISITVVHLFVSALRTMLHNYSRNLDEMSRSNDRKSQADLYVLPLKYTVLSTVAILSTLASWALYAATNVAFLLPFDCIVNCAALVFMTGQWLPVFVVVCSPLLRCVTQSSCLPCFDLSEVDEVIVALGQKQRERQKTTPSQTFSGTKKTITLSIASKSSNSKK